MAEKDKKDSYPGPGADPSSAQVVQQLTSILAEVQRQVQQGGTQPTLSPEAQQALDKLKALRTALSLPSAT